MPPTPPPRISLPLLLGYACSFWVAAVGLVCSMAQANALGTAGFMGMAYFLVQTLHWHQAWLNAQAPPPTPKPENTP